VIKRNGFTILGIPFHVGRPDRVTSDELLANFQDTANPRSLISSLNGIGDLAAHGGPHGRFAALKLLRICVTGKTIYATQLVPPTCAEEANEWAEANVSQSLLAIAGCDTTNADELSGFGAWRKRLAALPVSIGGMGLNSPVETGPLAFVGAAYAFLPLVLRRALMCASRWGASATLPDRLFGTPCYPTSGAAAPPLLPFQESLRDLRTHIASGLPASAKLLELTVDSGPQHGLQRRLTLAHYEALRPQLRLEARAEEVATGFSGLLLRFDAAANYGYGTWQNGAAGARFHSLVDNELKCAVRRHLCLSFADMRARAGAVSSCPHCRLPLDHLGAHVLACQGAGALDDKSHNLVRDALLGACQEAGFRAEPESPGLIDGTRERPADVFVPAPHGIGSHVHATMQACLDCCGVRNECPSHMQAGLCGALRSKHNAKKSRQFPPSAEALTAAATDGDRAGAACAAAGGSTEDCEAARIAARSRALEARRPQLLIVPIVFSSCGGFFDGEPRLGLRGVMDAMAARHKAGDACRAEGVGSAAVYDRWLPRVSTAIERGVWDRFERLLQDLRSGGVRAAARLEASDLPSGLARRFFMAPF